MLNKLKELLGPSSLGDGMADKAAKTISGRGYQLYKAEAKAMGETPLSPEAWAKTQR